MGDFPQTAQEFSPIPNFHMKTTTRTTTTAKFSRSTPTARLFAAFAAAGLAVSAAPSARATDYFWDVNGSTAGFSTITGAWNTSAFWNPTSTGGTGGTLIVNPTSADDLFVTGGTTGTITVTGNKTASSFSFGTSATALGVAATVSGGTSLTLGGTGALNGIFANNTAASSVTTPVILNSANTAFNFSNANSGLLTIGVVTGAATTGTQTVTIGSSGTGGITQSGIIGDGAAGGKVALVVNSTGAGGTTLSGANTFTGGVTLNAGTLNINSAGVAGTSGPLGNGGTFTINGGTINNTSGSAKTVANVNPIVLGGDFAFGTSAGTANNSLSLGGAVSMNGNRTITTNGVGTLTLSGVVANGSTTSGLTLSGTGTLALTGANTFTGGTTVNSGSTLLVGGTSVITSGNVSSGATGTGNVTFANNTSLNSASTATWFVPTITLGGTLNLLGNNRLNLAFKTLELTSGTKTINVNGKSVAVTGGNTLTSETTGISQWEMQSVTSLGTSTIQSSVSAGVLDLETTNAAFTGGNYAAMRINNATSFSNTDLIIGNNVLLFAANSGTLGSSAATSPNVTINANGILNLVASAATGRTVSMKSLAGSGSVFGSMVTTNTFATTLALNGTTGTTTFSGAIGNGPGSGALSLSKTGASTQILTGANTYTGTTTISAGSLQLGNGGTTGSLATTSSIVNNGNLTINRSNAVTQGTDFSSAAITGTGSFTQSGTGTTTLIAANTYTGTTTISAGTLQLGNGGTTGSLAITGSIVNNGNLTINRSNAVTQGTDFSSAAITGTGSFTQSGTGTTTLTAANTFSGLVTVNFGSTLATNATGTFGMGDISIATGGTLQLGNANSIADTANLKLDVGSSLLLGFTGTETVNSLSSVSGAFIAAGTYDANQLQAFFGDSSFAFSGMLNVLSGSASAVPEPSTYAALAGLGILGFAVCRRRKQS